MVVVSFYSRGSSFCSSLVSVTERHITHLTPSITHSTTSLAEADVVARMCSVSDYIKYAINRGESDGSVYESNESARCSGGGRI